MTVNATDTLHRATPTARPAQVPAHSWKKSTAQVLAELPDSATPWQQDSAIQAYFKPGQDIHYSEQPDTLGLPGQRVDVRYAPVPNRIWKDPAAFHEWIEPKTEGDSTLTAKTVSSGMMADPLPYHPSADPLVGTMLIGGFVIMVLLLSHSRNFIVKQLHSFFYTAKARTTQITEQPHEIWYQGALSFVTLLLCSITIYCGLLNGLHTPYFVQPHTILGASMAMAAGWFLSRTLLYGIVNWVFFTHKKFLQWYRAVLLLSGGFGIALLPVLLLHIFGHITWQASSTCIAFLFILVEILFIYKSFVTFFNRVGDLLQIILYFCALEMMPLAGLAGIFVMYHDNLRINF